MGNRIFVGVVVVLWLITMSWLVVAKILPPLDQGLPPNYRGLRTGAHSSWRIYWNNRQVGWAASKIADGTHGTKEIHSRLLLSEIPLADLAPSLIASLVENVGRIALDADSRIELDPLGNLSSFYTRLSVNDVPAIRMSGRVEDSELRLRIRAGDFTHKEHRFFPQGARLGNELTPDARMPGMYEGRKWKLQVFSPFRPPTDPVELIQGEVVGTQLIRYGSGTEDVKRIEFRRINSAGVAVGNDIRSVIWVTTDGTVLRQEVNILDAKVRFERVDDKLSERLVEDLLAPPGRVRDHNDSI